MQSHQKKINYKKIQTYGGLFTKFPLNESIWKKTLHLRYEN